MNRALLTALALLFLIGSCGGRTETRESFHENGRRKSLWGERQRGQGHWVKHGSYVEWDAKGTKRVDGRYADGMPDGKWSRFDPAGRLVEESTYDRGVIDGPHTLWWAESGTIRRRVEFLRGKMHGAYREWYADGTLAQEGLFENGAPKGPFTQYDRNGEKRRRGEYGEPFREEGEWVSWDGTGRVVDRCVFENGKPVRKIEGDR